MATSVSQPGCGMEATPVLGTWHAATPGLVAQLQCDGFTPQLDEALQALVIFDQSCVLFYPSGGSPLLLHDNLQGISEPGAMHNYLSGTYLLDPVYTACAHGQATGLYRMSELAPDAFFEGDYFNSPDVHPCISMQSGTLSEEIVFICALPGVGHLAYSLMRLNASAKFSPAQIEALQSCQAMVAVLLQRHYQGVGAHVDDSALALREHLNSAFSRFAADQLTPREQLIVSMILRGHSSLSISLHLGIAEGTVKNHRKHLYCKLGISSQSELFHLFVNFVLSHTASMPLAIAGSAIQFQEAFAS
ncbi:helix-turn-helix transcriptional regulator [Pseudomonas sp. BIC9C]|uniref:helix-turn-helix transcriptional regulator n=1 Tax=Pseudomonas sp. BIC9C TaxID=3078458 RepID=UPI002AD2740F|nr:LuxR C-terminal-related transcriptional regulator [Pseudomonas sp. BIC9C]